MAVKASDQPDLDTRLETVLATTGARDRVNLEKHIAACDAEPDPAHGQLWRRLIVKLAELVPLPVRSAGPHVIQFFIADGKYRMQVFTVEDNCDGSLNLYLPNVMTKAVSEKILAKHGSQYSPVGSDKQMEIEQMDSHHPSDPPDFVKHMMGWNRKAMKVTLASADLQSPLLVAAESLCTLAAKQWANTQAGVAAKRFPS